MEAVLRLLENDCSKQPGKLSEPPDEIKLAKHIYARGKHDVAFQELGKPGKADKRIIVSCRMYVERPWLT